LIARPFLCQNMERKYTFSQKSLELNNQLNRLMASDIITTGFFLFAELQKTPDIFQAVNSREQFANLLWAVSAVGALVSYGATVLKVNEINFFNKTFKRYTSFLKEAEKQNMPLPVLLEMNELEQEKFIINYIDRLQGL